MTANRLLWVLQLIGALIFIGHGFQLLNPSPQFAEMLGVLPFPKPFMNFIGIAEILGGIGLVLPALAKILPELTPIAAICLILIMLGAIGTHATRGEFPEVIGNLVIVAILGAIAYGRLRIAPLH